jgi:hypothetical protein
MTAPHPLYLAALSADEAFHIALVRAYGWRACDMRYVMRHDDEHVNQTKRAKLEADEAWRAEMERHRS